MDTAFYIDAVITWVDGEDPRHIAKRNQIIDAANTKAQAKTSKALTSVNEIAYCVESIIKYAPFIRTIFIVTDEQVPEIYYAYPDRIKIIDHKEIFNGHDVLPTINIFSIECMLYRIPGLAENFIYFNDDFFLIKPTQPEDWFVNGLPVIRGRWETLPEKIWYKRIRSWLGLKSDTRASFRKTQSTAAKLIGFNNQYFRCYHTPRALRKSTFEKFFQDNPDLLANQIKYRRRHPSQFNPYSLAWHLEIKNKTVVYASTVGIMELHHPENKSVNQTKRMLVAAEKNAKIICANIQNMNLASPEQQQLIFNWLNRVIPKTKS
jgi:hypothetical protein